MWPDVHTPAEAEARINEQKAEAIAALKGREPQNLEEQALTLVGKDIFKNLSKNIPKSNGDGSVPNYQPSSSSVCLFA